jgi:deazaflavin-dependent oxidoreductase (nitroreductase family)
MPMPRFVARINRVFSNRIMAPLAYVSPPFALVLHEGRRSGRTYRTPVWAFRRNGGYVIALTYEGPSDWVRNVIVAGGCRLRTPSGEREMIGARIVEGADGLALMPRRLRSTLLVMGVTEFLILETAP